MNSLRVFSNYLGHGAEDALNAEIQDNLFAKCKISGEDDPGPDAGSVNPSPEFAERWEKFILKNESECRRHLINNLRKEMRHIYARIAHLEDVANAQAPGSDSELTHLSGRIAARKRIEVKVETGEGTSDEMWERILQAYDAKGKRHPGSTWATKEPRIRREYIKTPVPENWKNDVGFETYDISTFQEKFFSRHAKEVLAIHEQLDHCQGKVKELDQRFKRSIVDSDKGKGKVCPSSKQTNKAATDEARRLVEECHHSLDALPVRSKAPVIAETSDIRFKAAQSRLTDWMDHMRRSLKTETHGIFSPSSRRWKISIAAAGAASASRLRAGRRVS